MLYSHGRRNEPEPPFGVQVDAGEIPGRRGGENVIEAAEGIPHEGSSVQTSESDSENRPPTTIGHEAEPTNNLSDLSHLVPGSVKTPVTYPIAS